MDMVADKQRAVEGGAGNFNTLRGNAVLGLLLLYKR
jgi:hypothetical protein